MEDYIRWYATLGRRHAQVEEQQNKTKVLSVQLGKTLSFVKFVVGWGVEHTKSWPPVMPRALLKVFGGGWVGGVGGLESEFSVHLWSKALA